MNNFELLEKVLLKYDLNYLKDYLFLDKNTINRWLLLKDVPKYYYYDLCNLLDIEIDYTKLSFEEKDQFFTSEESVKYCISVFKNKLNELNVDYKDYIYIEPSAGNGSFYKFLPIDRRIGLDIEPRYDGVIKQNYLNWEPIEKDKKYIVLGNPPFGLRGNLALRFIKHSEKFSDFVAFILPPLFSSSGKGSCMNRIKGMNLIHSEIIDPKFYYPDGGIVNVNVIFQIWSKNFKVDIKVDKCSEYIKIYSLSDGGTPGSTRNKKMLNECDIYLPSTCFGVSKMKHYFDFEELPHRRGYGIKILKESELILEILKKTNWSDESFKSTNSALNLRISIIENILTRNGFIDRKEESN
jgi:hypothetical protein